MGEIINMPIIDLGNYHIGFWNCDINKDNYCISCFWKSYCLRSGMSIQISTKWYLLRYFKNNFCVKFLKAILRFFLTIIKQEKLFIACLWLFKPNLINFELIHITICQWDFQNWSRLVKTEISYYTITIIHRLLIYTSAKHSLPYLKIFLALALNS